MEDDNALQFQSDLWNLITPHTEEQGSVMMSAAIMLKTAIQLYTCVMNDEDIERLLQENVCESIPQMRSSMQDQLTRVIH